MALIDLNAYYQDPRNPKRILCIQNISDKEKRIMEFCEWEEISPTFINYGNKNE